MKENFILNIFQKFSKSIKCKDLIYFLIIESCYNPPFHFSRAIGMWQINSITARQVQLKEGIFLDERLNWQKSTIAAAEYLVFLKEKIFRIGHLFSQHIMWVLDMFVHE